MVVDVSKRGLWGLRQQEMTGGRVSHSSHSFHDRTLVILGIKCPILCKSQHSHMSLNSTTPKRPREDVSDSEDAEVILTAASTPSQMYAADSQPNVRQDNGTEGMLL